MATPSIPFHYRGGVFRDLPEKTGKERHHLLPNECLEIIGLDSDYGPAILMDHSDHVLTRSNGSTPQARRWRAETLRLLREGNWDQALAREIADVERIAPGKYTAAIQEAREKGLGLWPGLRNDQLELSQGADVEALDPTWDAEPEPDHEDKLQANDEPQQLELDDWKAEARAFMRGHRDAKENAPSLPPPGRDDGDRGIGD